MSREERLFIEDIRAAAQKIAQYTRGLAPFLHSLTDRQGDSI